jgi:hypothetical protein
VLRALGEERTSEAAESGGALAPYRIRELD